MQRHFLTFLVDIGEPFASKTLSFLGSYERAEGSGRKGEGWREVRGMLLRGINVSPFPWGTPTFPPGNPAVPEGKG